MLGSSTTMPWPTAGPQDCRGQSGTLESSSPQPGEVHTSPGLEAAVLQPEELSLWVTRRRASPHRALTFKVLRPPLREMFASPCWKLSTAARKPSLQVHTRGTPWLMLAVARQERGAPLAGNKALGPGSPSWEDQWEALGGPPREPLCRPMHGMEEQGVCSG